MDQEKRNSAITAHIGFIVMKQEEVSVNGMMNKMPWYHLENIETTEIITKNINTPATHPQNKT